MENQFVVGGLTMSITHLDSVKEYEALKGGIWGGGDRKDTIWILHLMLFLRNY